MEASNDVEVNVQEEEERAEGRVKYRVGVAKGMIDKIRGRRVKAGLAALFVIVVGVAVSLVVADMNTRKSDQAVREIWKYEKETATFLEVSNSSGLCFVPEAPGPVGVDAWNKTHMKAYGEWVWHGGHQCKERSQRRLEAHVTCPHPMHSCSARQYCWFSGWQTSTSHGQMNHYGYIKGASKSETFKSQHASFALEGKAIKDGKKGYAHCHAHAKTWIWVDNLQISCTIMDVTKSNSWGTVYWGGHVGAEKKCHGGEWETCCTD